MCAARNEYLINALNNKNLQNSLEEMKFSETTIYHTRFRKKRLTMNNSHQFGIIELNCFAVIDKMYNAKCINCIYHEHPYQECFINKNV